MKKSFTLTFLIALSFGILSCTGELKASQAAPNFSLPAASGELIKLSDQKGKYVVLEWFNDGCPYVKKHYESGNMQGLQKQHTSEGVFWLTILSNAPGKQGHRSPQEIKKIMKDFEASPSQILLDPMGKVGRLYGAKTTPHMFIINPEGQIIYQGAIDSNPSTKAEDIPGSKNYVAAALGEAKAGKPVSAAATTPYGCSVKYQ